MSDAMIFKYIGNVLPLAEERLRILQNLFIYYRTVFNDSTNLSNLEPINSTFH